MNEAAVENRSIPITEASGAVRAVPATCGELVQGSYDGIPALISCPIDRWAVAEARLVPGHGLVRARHLADGRASPLVESLGSKAWAGLRGLDVPSGFDLDLRLRSPIPRSRGMGSSTADLCAVRAAAGAALGDEPGPAELAAIAASIEPSDGTMAAGLAVFAHRSGEILELLGPPPELWIIVVDPGGEVDTLAFNARGPSARGAASPDLVERAARALAAGDLTALGAAATESAESHQGILPSPLFPRLRALAPELGALGVVVAHSGTVAGLLFDRDPGPELLGRADDALAERSPSAPLAGPARGEGGSRSATAMDRKPGLRPHRVVAGGVRRCLPERSGIPLSASGRG